MIRSLRNRIRWALSFHRDMKGQVSWRRAWTFSAHQAENEWRSYNPVFHRPALMDGTEAKWFAELMRRRRPDNSWEYRPKTENEMLEAQDDFAW